ncbi:uncharacterized protein LOC118434097 [Folsomia candida]|nr:uncharacterized protein LOC118434097 [Folsomia candida]XP_035702792.1 uncharacterized protein LOC118434097 [Folsomia candida]
MSKIKVRLDIYTEIEIGKNLAQAVRDVAIAGGIAASVLFVAIVISVRSKSCRNLGSSCKRKKSNDVESSEDQKQTGQEGRDTGPEVKAEFSAQPLLGNVPIQSVMDKPVYMNLRHEERKHRNKKRVPTLADFGGHYQNVREYWEHYEKSGKK